MSEAASGLLARLQILLDADTAEFDRNIGGAADTADTNFSKIRDKAKMMGVGLAAAAVAGAAALAAMTAQTIEMANEIQNAAAVAGISAEAMQYYAAGAKTLGIEQDALGDIIADAAEKMGEMAATEGGGLADFFENVAGKTNLTAEAFMKLKPPEALIAMVTAAEKANLSYEQTRFYLESFASDSTKLLPLLKNGGEGFKFYGDMAKRYGAILSDDAIANTNKLSTAQYMLELQSTGLKNQIVTATLPTIVQLADAFSTTTDNGVKLIGVGDIISNVMKGIAASALGAYAALDLTSEKLNEYTGYKNIAKTFEWRDLFPVASGGGIYKKMLVGAAVAQQTEAEDGLTQFQKKFELYAAKLNNIWDPTASQNNLAQAEKFLNTSGNLGRAAAEESAKAAKAASDSAAKAADAAKKAIQQAYASQESGLKRQIALFDITSTAAQLKYDLENTEMAKFLPQQKAYLLGLAQELEFKKADKLYLDSYKDAAGEAKSLKLKYDISRQIYDLEQQGAEKYKELSKTQRDTLVDMEVKNRLTSEYQSLVAGLQTSEESRGQQLREQLSTLNYALNAGAIDAEMYASQLQRVFDSGATLPDFAKGNMDMAGIESAQLELENRYAMEAELRKTALDEKFLTEQAYQESVLNLELDYNLRKTTLEDQLQQAQAARQKGYQDTAVSFFTKGLDVMAASGEKYSKVAKAAQKAMALYQIGKDTAAAAMAAYKAVVGIPIVGPTLAPIAAGAAIAFGAMQAKAVMSDSNAAATAISPNTAATTVTPVAEQQKAAEVLPRQTTTLGFPADKLMIGRDVVDFINEAVADGKRIDPRAFSAVAI